jgi:hypothetical protein
MPQRASVFCNFYIRVDREALVSERALDVGSVAFKAMSTKTIFLFTFFTKRKLLRILQNVIAKSFISWRVLPLVKVNTRVSDTPCICIIGL